MRRKMEILRKKAKKFEGRIHPVQELIAGPWRHYAGWGFYFLQMVRLRAFPGRKGAERGF